MSPFFGMIQGTNFTIFLIVFLEAMFFFTDVLLKKHRVLWGWSVVDAGNPLEPTRQVRPLFSNRPAQIKVYCSSGFPTKNVIILVVTVTGIGVTSKDIDHFHCPQPGCFFAH